MPTADLELVRSAMLRLAPCRADHRDDWIKVGMALHSVSNDEAMLMCWMDWSRLSEKFDEKECRRQWKSFRNGAGIGFGTLFHMANADSPGWREAGTSASPNRTQRRQRSDHVRSGPRQRLTLDSPEEVVARVERSGRKRAVGAWIYWSVDQSGVDFEAFTVVRFDLETIDPVTGKRRKEFRPYHPTRSNPSNALEVALGYPDGDRVLYWLPELLKAPAAEVIYVCEGEKAADALNRSTGFVATTSAGGCNAIRQTDWSPLRGRSIVLVPDNDEAGERWAKELGRLLLERAPGVRVVVRRLRGLTPKGDAADFFAPGTVR